MAWYDEFSDFLERDRPLAPLTTYRVGGTARWFFLPPDAESASRLLARLAREGLPWRVLGGGANVLIDDGVHETPIIHLARLDRFDVDGVRVTAGAGVPFSKLVQDTVQGGLAGLDGLCGIPGQVGGACAMNAGGRHGELGDRVVEVEVATAKGVRRLGREEVGFAYRATSLPDGVVTAVTVALATSDDPGALRRRMGGILKEKAAAQPLWEPSGGCIFANPEGGSAGLMVESLGLKGEALGAAAISEKHGNFIVNRGEARFQDVVALIERIEKRVLEERGIALRREIKVWHA